MVDRLGISKEAPSLNATQSLAQPTLTDKVLLIRGRVIHFGQEDPSAPLVEFGFNRNIYAIRWSDDFQRRESCSTRNRRGVRRCRRAYLILGNVCALK